MTDIHKNSFTKIDNSIFGEVNTIAKNIKFNKEPIEKNIQYTGLTEDEIEQL